MKVRATAPGVMGNSFKNIGDEFDVPKDLFSSVWMEPIAEPVEEPKPKTHSFFPNFKGGHK